MEWSPLTLWLAILFMGAGTFALRWSFIGWMERFDEPSWLRGVLKFVPVSVMAALVVAGLLHSGAFESAKPLNPRLLAALIASIVAIRTKSLLLTIALGMTSLWVLQYFLD